MHASVTWEDKGNFRNYTYKNHFIVEFTVYNFTTFWTLKFFFFFFFFLLSVCCPALWLGLLFWCHDATSLDPALDQIVCPRIRKAACYLDRNITQMLHDQVMCLKILILFDYWFKLFDQMIGINRFSNNIWVWFTLIFEFEWILAFENHWCSNSKKHPKIEKYKTFGHSNNYSNTFVRAQL